MSPIMRYLLWAKPYWWLIGMVIFIGILQFGPALAMPIFTGVMIDDVLVNQDVKSLYVVVALMAAVLFGGIVLNFLNGYMSAILGNKMMRHLRDELYNHLQKMSVGYYEQRQVGSITARVIHDIGGAQNLIGGGIIRVALDCLLIVVASVLLVKLDPILTLITLCVLPLYYLSFTNMNVHIRLAWRSVHRQMERLYGTLVERMSGIRIVQAFNGEQMEGERFKKQTQQHFKHTMTAHIVSNVLGTLSQTFAHVGGLVIWVVGGTFVIKGTMTAGDLVAFQLLVGNLYGPIQRFADVNVTIQNSVTNVERIFEMFDEEPDIVEADDAIALPACTGNVRFENVKYTYTTRNLIYKNENGTEQERDLVEKEKASKSFYWVPTNIPPDRPDVEIEKREGIREISFEAQAGEVVALIGPSGAGKSTLINLIPRFYDAEEGTVYVDDVDIRNYKLNDLRQHIALVLQDNVLFSGTIRENLVYGRPDATDEELIEAAKAANAHEFILTFKDGYDTRIGERGMRLSGGQKQRLAIARALLKNPRILILDEATSALDSESEALVTEALERLMIGRTTFIIAHRLATIVRADQILVINEGTIVQRGTHRELLQEGGLYRKLYEQQLNAMRPEELAVIS